MAKFIKIKASNIGVANQSADYLIGADQVQFVKQGTHIAASTADAATVLLSGGKHVTFTDTGKGAEIASAINSALTANPGGVVATVQLGSAVSITAIGIN